MGKEYSGLGGMMQLQRELYQDAEQGHRSPEDDQPKTKQDKKERRSTKKGLKKQKQKRKVQNDKLWNLLGS
jgi:hypothetical protein